MINNINEYSQSKNEIMMAIQITDKKEYKIRNINNKDIFIDINDFLNDGNEENIENKILKEDSYELISKELWESFKEYGYDIEINPDIINNNENNFPAYLKFLKNEKNFSNFHTLDSIIIYIDNKINLINKIVKCLNYGNNRISEKIRYFYNNTKFDINDFSYNNNNENFLISFNRYNKSLNITTNKSNNIVLVGLINIGSTCYMNSVLQILNNIREFSEYLCTNDISKENCPISNSLKTIFLDLRNPKYNYKYLYPIDFQDVVVNNNPNFIKNEPNDSRELIQYLLNSIHKELNSNKNKNYPDNDESDVTNWKDTLKYEKDYFNYENKSIITDLFYGIQATETYCYNCKKISYVFEHFNILTLPILKGYNNSISVNDMLTDFSKNIQLTGNNCLNCNRNYYAYCRNVLYEMPKFLIIHPERKNKGIKYDIRIDYEEKLNIKISENLGKEKIEYNLIGIIYHYITTKNEKHNIAYCKKGDCWYEFNDHIISLINIEDISGEGIILLIYEMN